MTKLNILAGVATAAVLTFAVSGTALAHSGMGGHVESHVGGNPTSKLGHITNLTQTNKEITETRKVSDFDDRRRFGGRRFHFLRYGYLDIDAAPVCFYKWTHLGRVRICPDLDY